MATYYFWDEIEDNVIREYDESNNTIAHYSTEPTRYGSVINQERSGVTRYYHFDGQGNTTELTDENGNVTDTRRYSAFGGVTESTGTSEFPYQWGGQLGLMNDESVAQWSMRRGSLSFSTNRLTSVDSASIEMGESCYTIAGNNPVNARTALVSLSYFVPDFNNPVPLHPTGTLAELLGSILGVLLGGKITGPCGQGTLTYVVTLDDIDYYGGGNLLLIFLRSAINGKRNRPYKKNCKDVASRCCTVATINTSFSATFIVILVDVPVPGLFYKPDPKVTISLSGKSNDNVGLCITRDCPCPPPLPTNNLTLTLGTFDLGSIEYSALKPYL